MPTARFPFDRLLTRHLFDGFRSGEMTRLGDRVMPRWLDDAGHLIVEHLGDPAYDLAALAQACRLGPAHCAYNL